MSATDVRLCQKRWPELCRRLRQVRDIYLHPDRFSAQNSLLTAGQRPRRPQRRAYFRPQLDDLYARLGSSDAKLG